MMMQPPIAYAGNQPYIFVSYAHVDNDRVWPIIDRLQKMGFRIWYDNGIDPGTEWDKTIASHLMECTLFLVVMSKGYLASENCKDELSYSRDLNKNRVIIHLEEVVLPPELAMRIGRSQALFYYMYQNNINDFYSNLMKATGMMSCYTAPVPVSNPYATPQQFATQPPVQPSAPANSVPTQVNSVPSNPGDAMQTSSNGFSLPPQGKGIPGFRSHRVWKRIVAIHGYLWIVVSSLIMGIGISNVTLHSGVGFGLELFIFQLLLVFIVTDFLHVNELFSFSSKSKTGHIMAKVLQALILLCIFAAALIVLILTDPRYR